MISKLFSREPDTRVFFATDIHGSETCWRKFLNSGKHYEAKVMILGGDMTGKAPRKPAGIRERRRGKGV
jgi:Icc-related predicted phosphoesterase